MSRQRCASRSAPTLALLDLRLFLLSTILLAPGDAAWMESPGYRGASGPLRASGARVFPVPIDGEGLDVAYGVAHCPQAKLAYVTPSHQMPLGVSMSLPRWHGG